MARALLKDNKWKVVALTRDVNSDKAKELKSMGAELRACNMLKPEDVEAAVKVCLRYIGCLRQMEGCE